MKSPRVPRSPRCTKRWARPQHEGFAGGRRVPLLAFTLIELLVVVAIIALLALIGFPAFASMQSKSKDARCLGNLKQLYLASLAYSADNNNYTPMFSQPGDPVQGNFWHRRIINYVVPGTGPWTFGQRPGNPLYNPNNTKCFVCPSDKAPLGGVLSYGMSQELPPKMMNIPSRVIFIGDVDGRYAYTLQPSIRSYPTQRHSGKTENFIFADGHAETRIYPMYSENKNLWTP